MIMTERKISLPAYKLAYAFCFVVILSLIRGISFSYEIGLPQYKQIPMGTAGSPDRPTASPGANTRPPGRR